MNQTMGPNEKPTENGEERIILGAAAIAEYIFGDRHLRSKVLPRGIYEGSNLTAGCAVVLAARHL